MDRNQPVKSRHGARGVAVGACVVLAVLACIVILAVLGLGFYALHKIKPGWLRIQAGVWRLITFSMEIGQPGVPATSPKP